MGEIEVDEGEDVAHGIVHGARVKETHSNIHQCQCYLPQRKVGRKEQGLKIRKENSSKLNEMQGFLTLGHSNWTICSLLN